MRAALASGELRSAGKWYADATAPSDAVLACSMGGRLGCLSATRLHGLWTPETPSPHVLFRRETGGKTVIAHRLSAWGFTGPVAPLRESVRQAIRFHDAETGLIVLESALNSGALDDSDAEQLVSEAADRKQRVLNRFQSTAQSGTETRVRLWFQQRRVPVRAQVEIEDVGYVDLLVGSSLVIELDSRAHHTAAADYANDRRRDLVLHRRGYRVIRLTYQQVFGEWEKTQQVLAELIADRAHRRRTKPAC